MSDDKIGLVVQILTVILTILAVVMFVIAATQESWMYAAVNFGFIIWFSNMAIKMATLRKQ